MRDEGGRHSLKLWWTAGERPDTGGDHDSARHERLTVGQRQAKTLGVALDARYTAPVDVPHSLMLKPEAVRDETIERNRHGNLTPGLGAKRIERQFGVGVRQIRCRVRRTKEHALGHL